MRFQTPSAVLVAVLALAPSVLPPAAAGEPSPAERKISTALAEDLVEWTRTCLEGGALEEAKAALEEARALDHLVKGFHEAETALAAATAPATPDADALSRKRRTAAAALAKNYDRLAAAAPEDADGAARAARSLARAMAWEPADGRRKKVLSLVEKQADGGGAVTAGALLQAVKGADPEGVEKGKYDALEAGLGQKDRLVLGSTASPLLAHVSLPKGWTKAKSWPVLVAVEGAGCNFEGQFKGFVTARGSRPFIVVTPLSLTNTNALEPAKYPAYGEALLKEWDARRMEFDGPGLDGILADLVKRFGAGEKVFLTGFSGGGNLCYWKLLTDPARVAGAAPACANFAGYGLDGAPGAGEGGGPPVHLLTGEKDPHRDFTFGNKDSPGIEPQTDRVEAELKRLGYTDVKRTMVPGAGHSPLRAEVWEFIDGVRERR